jgi:hypothetical protein
MRINIHKLHYLKSGNKSTDILQSATIKYSVWKDAINHYLKTRDRNAAISYLNSRFNRFAENRFDLIDRLHFLTELNGCIDDYIQLKMEPHLRKINFEFAIDNRINVYGQVPRIDKSLENDKYYISFYIHDNMGWQHDIKYALIQSWFASNVLETETSKICIGVYNIENNRHEFVCYSEAQIDMAWNEARMLTGNLVKPKDQAVKTEQPINAGLISFA